MVYLLSIIDVFSGTMNSNGVSRFVCDIYIGVLSLKISGVCLSLSEVDDLIAFVRKMPEGPKVSLNSLNSFFRVVTSIR